MTAGVVLLVAQLVAVVVLIAYVVGRHYWRRRSSFDATLAREHPELPALPPLDGLAQVAASAINVHTPAAPRELGGWELR